MELKDKMRIVQELVPGKQITLCHIIANPDKARARSQNRLLEERYRRFDGQPRGERRHYGGYRHEVLQCGNRLRGQIYGDLDYFGLRFRRGGRVYRDPRIFYQ